MNKNVIIVIAVALLLLVGGAYLMSTKNKTNTTPATTSDTITTAVEETSGVSQRSLKDLLAAGAPQKCTYTDVSEGTNIEGTSYIADGKVRSDFSSTTDGTTTLGHTIFDGKTSYVWMDGTTTGFKMDIDPSATTTSEIPNEQGVDLNKAVEYSCSVWVPDRSLFAPPSDVTFTGFAVPSSTAVTSPTGNQNLCDSCNALSGEQKTQCLTALKCDL